MDDFDADGVYGSCEMCGCDLDSESLGIDDLCDQCLWWQEEFADNEDSGTR